MKKTFLFMMTSILLIVSAGCSNKTTQDTKENVEMKEHLQIEVQGDDQSIIFQLNDSVAAQSFYDQLPLTIKVENYSHDEKIIYPPKKLDVTNTPLAKGPIGTLAYYEPWGDVVMYYDVCNGANGLYALGSVVSGEEQIKGLHGDITIRKVNETTTKQ